MAQVKCNKGGLDSLISSLTSAKSKIDEIYNNIENDVQTINQDAIDDINNKLTTKNNTLDNLVSALENPNTDSTSEIDSLRGEITKLNKEET